MAIQKINLGTEPLGEGGDTYRSANTKINENFSNTTHAASQLMTTAGGIVPFWSSNLGINNTGWGGLGGVQTSSSKPESGKISKINASNIGLPFTGWAGVASMNSDTNYGTYIAWSQSSPTTVYFGGVLGGTEQPWAKVYTDKNTTKDVATGFLKASSPVLHVYNDKITKIHEAEQLDITVDKKGVGHYEIHGTTGLRKNDGWFMSPPRDMHSNVLCMVDYEEKDGVITLKTYKKKFDFETVSIVHDYDNPMDIPEGSCVEFRFNDLPQEDLGKFPTSEAK